MWPTAFAGKEHETCEAVGLNSFHIGLSADDGQHALMAAVAQFNNDPAVRLYRDSVLHTPAMTSTAG